MSSILEIHQMDLAVAATALHDGSNEQGYPHKLEGFVVQALGDTHFGSAEVTGASDGFTVRDGESVSVTGFLSRGTPHTYDLTQMYYIGGPWKLVIERQV